MGMKKRRIWGSLDPFFESGPILGRRVANAGFLEFLLRENPFDEYHFFLGDQAQRKALEEGLARVFPDTVPGVRFFMRRDLPRMLAQEDYHAFHQSDCINFPQHLARLRNRHSRGIFPITSLTHSLSYANYGGFFFSHIWPGATPRDCIVSTSRAGLRVMNNFFSYLRANFMLGETEFPAPSLRRIPLGVDPDLFSPSEEKDRKDWRLKLGLDQERVLVLVFGRIAHYSKMDILPLLRSFQRLFSQGLDRNSVGLVLAGWVDDEDDFSKTIAELCVNIGLDLKIVSRPSDGRKLGLFSACDLFLSIADNPQETFGLTLLEAGASGLPVIASDYDGYRDLVRHGETGLLVPTIGPGGSLAGTSGLDMLAPVLFDNQYHLLMAQQTAVDVPMLSEALGDCLASDEYRQDMGRKARVHVLEKFTWTSVIHRYVELWDELWSLPVDAASLRNIPHPLHLPYGEVFGHYASQTLAPDQLLKSGRVGEAVYRGRDFPLVYAGLEDIVDGAMVKRIVFLARKPVSAGELARRVLELAPELNPDMTRDQAGFLLLWCLKHDILELDRE